MGGTRYFSFRFTQTRYVSSLARYGSLFTTALRRTPGRLELFDRHFPGVGPPALPEVLRADPDQVVAMVNDVVAQIDPTAPAGETTFDRSSDVSGHLGVLHNRVDHGAEAKERISDKAFPLRGPFSAFPGGLVLLPSSLGPQYLLADDKRAFLRQNDADIRAFNDASLAAAKGPGWSFEGHYAILGNGSLVRAVAHIASTSADGSILNLVHMQTTSWHVFDGSFVWAYRWSPERPDFIDGIGIQAGKHAWYDLDQANAVGGVALFHSNNFSAPDVLNARKLGAYVTGDRSVVKDWSVRALSACLASLDHVSPWLQELRGDYGPPFTMAEIDDAAADRIVAAGPASIEEVQLPSASDTGVTFAGHDVIVQDPPLGTPAGPPGSDDVRTATDALMKYQMTQAAWADIERAVEAFAAGRLGSEWTTKSRAELIGALLTDPESRAQIESIIADRTLGAVLPQLEGVIAGKEPTPEVATALRRGVTDRFRLETISQLLTDGGALRSSLELQVLEQQAALIDGKSLDASLSAAKDRATQAAAEVARLKQAAAGATGDELKRIEADLAAHAQAEADADAAAATYQAQRDDLDQRGELSTRWRDQMSEQSRRIFSDHD
jgi:hypothetical protein